MKLQVGKCYAAHVNRRRTIVKLVEIRTIGTGEFQRERYYVLNLSTGRRAIFEHAGRFDREVEPPRTERRLYDVRVVLERGPGKPPARSKANLEPLDLERAQVLAASESIKPWVISAIVVLHEGWRPKR